MFRKIFTSSIISLVLLGGMFLDVHTDTTGEVAFVSESYAAPDCGGANQPKCTSEQEMVNMYNRLVEGINIALQILSFIVSPAIMLAGWLMSPDWTTGDLFNLRPILHKLWILVSNITYFIYAILLIFIALATIFNSQNYGYKKLLPRLALGIILVPLTWWFVQFIISLSTIVTASVMNLPAEVMDNYIAANSSPDSWWISPTIPTTYELYTDPAVLVSGAPPQYTQGPFISPKDILTNSSGIYGSLLIYGNGLFKINEAKRLNTTQDVLESVAGLAHKGILSVIMFIVFGFLVIALVFMLMMRAIKLWFYAIFSPLLTLRYVVGDGIFGGKENGDSFEIKEFVGLAFVPALVGMALSFGIVVISVLQSPNAGNAGAPCDAAAMQPNGAGCKMMNIMGSPDNYISRKVEERDPGDGNITNIGVTEVKMGGITFKFYGSTVSDSEIAVMANNVTQYRSTLSAAGSVFGTLIVDIIALIFIWAAFMAAKNVSKVAKAAFEPFEAMGKRVGKLAMDMPKYTPIPGTGGLSLKGAEKLANNAQYALDKKHEEEFKSTRYGKMFGGDKVVQKHDEDYINKAFSDNNIDGAKKAAGKIKELVNAGKDIEYSSIPEDLAKTLKSKSQSDKLEYLKWMGYDNDAAQKLIDRLNLNGGEYKKGDSELISALKSIGSKSSSSGTQQFTATKIEGSKDDEKKVELKFNDTLKIQVDRASGDFKDDAKLEELKKLAKTMTESEFRSKFSGVGDGIVNGIVGKVKDEFRPPEAGKTPPSGTPTQPPAKPADNGQYP